MVGIVWCEATVWLGNAMELHKALVQIDQIRLQMARAALFRGYRAATVSTIGAIAILAGVAQAALLSDPAGNIGAYLAIWIGTGLIGVTLVGFEMMARYWHTRSPLTKHITWNAVEQFLPTLAACGLVTVILVPCAHESLWMLPGLWQIMFSLGIFASCRFLPRQISLVGTFYLVTGLGCLALAQGQWAFSPWAMAGPFGIGHFLTAAILYWTLERGDDTN